jgi:DNA polymerase elongation subunit (family B)
MISEKMGVLVSDAMGTVKPWSQYISNRSHTNKQCVPPMKSTDEAASIVGGHVRTPQAGKHKWILSADVNSMYPLLGMVGFNMSPETYLSKHQLPQELRDIVLKYFNDENEQDRLDMDPKVWEKTEQLLKQYKLSLGINGAVFENSKVGVVPDMIQEIYKSRKQAKKTMFKYEKQGIIIKEILKDRK